jgi:hypothetical protein
MTRSSRLAHGYGSPQSQQNESGSFISLGRPGMTLTAPRSNAPQDPHPWSTAAPHRPQKRGTPGSGDGGAGEPRLALPSTQAGGPGGRGGVGGWSSSWITWPLRHTAAQWRSVGGVKVRGPSWPVRGLSAVRPPAHGDLMGDDALRKLA